MDLEKAEKTLQSLGNSTRIKIFKLLAIHGKVGICSTGIAKELDVPQNTISFHLANMKNAGLAISKREGKNIIYWIRKENLEELWGFLFKDCCSASFRICEKCGNTKEKNNDTKGWI